MNTNRDAQGQIQQRNPLITREELTAELKICLRHLDNLTRRRLIPHIRLGRAIRYDPTAVRKALDKLTIKAIS